MDHLDALVNEAIAAYKAGRKDDARAKLLAVIEQNERHENAWLWLSGMTDSPEEQQICLENVLAINPANQRARKGLEKVRGKTPPATPPTLPAPPPSPVGNPFGDASFEAFDSTPEAASPFGSAPASSEPSPFGDISFDDITGGPSSASAASAAGDPFGSASDFDWDSPPASGAPAAHGSGGDVDLPSPEQYDEWMAQLNINTGLDDLPAAGASASPFGESGFDDNPFDTGDAFGTETFDAASTEPSPWDAVDSGGDVFGSSAAQGEDDPWGTDDTPFSDLDDSAPSFLDSTESVVAGEFGDSGFDFDSVEDSDPFDAGDPFAVDDVVTSSAPSTPLASSAFDSPFEFGDDSGDDIATFDTSSPFEVDDDELDDEDEDDDNFDFSFDFGGGSSAASSGFDDDPFGDIPAAAPRATASTAAAKLPGGASAQKYFSQIPGEIEAVPGGISQQSMMLLGGVIVLIVLNLASFALLLTNL